MRASKYNRFARSFADFNGDGKPDLLLNVAYDSYYLIFLGNGDGSFQSPLKYSGAASVGVGDFDRDGIPDLALVTSVNGGSSTLLSFCWGMATARFAQARPIQTRWLRVHLSPT